MNAPTDGKLDILFDGSDFDYGTAASHPAWDHYAILPMTFSSSKTSSEWDTYFTALDMANC